MKTINNLKELEEVLNNNVFTILKFSTVMFDICKEISPFFKEMSEKTKYSNIYFAEIDPNVSQDIYQKYKVSILPTFILFENDKELSRFFGSDKTKLKNMINMCFN